jgi:hypothetical protein
MGRGDRLSMNDLSITGYMGSTAHLTGWQPLTSGEQMFRVTLMVYSSKGYRRNNDKSVGPPPGTGYIMMDMRDVYCTSMSTGGSGGEDRLTLNMTVIFHPF